MKAVNIREYGLAENLEIIEMAIPRPAPDEVLIKIAAAGINRPDIIQRNGLYPPPPGASPIMGLECAGTITEIGSNVDSWKVGDQVCALLTGGGYAQYAIAHSGCCLPIPQSFNMEKAAALPETFFTVWSNLFDRAELKAGETLLIHGGTSGIGTTAIQIAKAFSIKVITTSGSDIKCQQTKMLGADHSINYRKVDFVESIRNITNGKGVDVILDMVAGDYVGRNVNSLAEDGRLIIIAVQGGVKADFNILPIMKKRLKITGSTLRPRDNQFKSEIAANLLKNVWPLLADGTINPVIDKIFPLEDIIDAHTYLERGEHFGKVILKI
jgi:NADPH2:quinone reductase